VRSGLRAFAADYRIKVSIYGWYVYHVSRLNWKYVLCRNWTVLYCFFASRMQIRTW